MNGESVSKVMPGFQVDGHHLPKALRSTISRSSARTGGMGGRVLGRHFMFVDGNDPHDPLVNKQKTMEIRHLYIHI